MSNKKKKSKKVTKVTPNNLSNFKKTFMVVAPIILVALTTFGIITEIFALTIIQLWIATLNS